MNYPNEMNALITGATRGIGRAIALKLAENGYNLAICARTKQDLDRLRVELEANGVSVLARTVDCTDKEALKIFLEEVIQSFTKVDVLVNNVGLFTPGALLDEADETFENQQLVNVNATYYFSKRIGQLMRNQRSGHIFNICSVASKSAVKNAGSYSVTKAAMLSLNHVLRMELALHQVKVTAIVPGSTYTSSWEGTTLPPEQFVQPGDIARSILHILNLSTGVNIDELVITPLNFEV